MVNLLTAVELRKHVETDLGDDALQQLIDASDAEIVRRLGPVVTQSEVLAGEGEYLPLARGASSITSITERFTVMGLGISDVALAANDYTLLASGFRAERLVTGTNPSQVFRGAVTVVYTPLDTTAERKMLLVKLVKLELGYSGHIVMTAGDERAQQLGNYADEKAALFRSLATGGRRLIT